MRTLADIEARSDEIKFRLNQILIQISEGSDLRNGDVMTSLAEEMALLLHEAKVLNTSLIYAREVTEQLLNCPCHGPH
jgi:hypothetical protein